jgi:hypothetical protein
LTAPTPTQRAMMNSSPLQHPLPTTPHQSPPVKSMSKRPRRKGGCNCNIQSRWSPG